MSVPPEAYLIEGGPAGAIHVLDALDLDDDGVVDRWVTAPHFCGADGDCVYAVYLSRQECPLYVGLSWGNGEITQLPSQHFGLHDFETVNDHMGNRARVRYRYDGYQYVGTEQQICLSSPREVVRCGAWSSLGGVPLPAARWRQPGLWPHRYAE